MESQYQKSKMELHAQQSITINDSSRRNPQSDIDITASHKIESELKQTHDDKRGEEKLDLWSIATTLCTGILALFTILLAFYTRRLALSTEDTAIRQNRAYVQVDIEKIFIGVGATAEIVLKISNVGKTPAYDVVGFSWVDLRPFPHPPNGNFDGPPGVGPESKMIIHGGQGHRIKTGSAHPITQSQAAAIAQGTTSRLYVFGNVLYTDAFKIKRFTHFCFAVRTEPNVISDIAYCQQHNEAN